MRAFDAMAPERLAFLYETLILKLREIGGRAIITLGHSRPLAVTPK